MPLRRPSWSESRSPSAMPGLLCGVFGAVLILSSSMLVMPSLSASPRVDAGRQVVGLPGLVRDAVAVGVALSGLAMAAGARDRAVAAPRPVEPVPRRRPAIEPGRSPPPAAPGAGRRPAGPGIAAVASPRRQRRSPTERAGAEAGVTGIGARRRAVGGALPRRRRKLDASARSAPVARVGVCRPPQFASGASSAPPARIAATRPAERPPAKRRSRACEPPSDGARGVAGAVAVGHLAHPLSASPSASSRLG